MARFESKAELLAAAEAHEQMAESDDIAADVWSDLPEVQPEEAAAMAAVARESADHHWSVAARLRALAEER